MRRNIYLLGIFSLILLLSLFLVSAAVIVITDFADTSLTTTGADSEFRGYRIIPNTDITLLNVTVHSSDTSNACNLTDNSNAVLQNAIVILNNASFNYNLIAGTPYRVVCGGSGATTMAYRTVAFTGINATHINFTDSIYAGVLNNIHRRTVISITTQTVTISSLNVTLTYPSNGFSTPLLNTYLNATVTPTQSNITNITFHLWKSDGTLVNRTTNILTGNISNSSNVFIENLINGQEYKWNAEACGVNSSSTILCSFSSANRTFIVSPFLGFIYNNNTLEGTIESYGANISYDSTVYTSITGTLYYNRISYSGTKIGSGNNIIFNRTLTTPIVSADSNISFYWQLILVNSTTSTYINSSTYNQTVQNIAFDDCSSFGILIYNFTHIDEDTELPINYTTFNSSIEINLNLSSLGTLNGIANFSRNYTTWNARVCLNKNLSTTSYRADATVRYGAGGYVTELYHIQNTTISNSTVPKNINLFNLLTSRSQEFLITFKDTNFLPVAGALIEIQRKYVGQGQYKIIEIPKTDASGQTLGHLVLSNIIYTLIVKKENKVLGTFEDIVAFCNNQATGDCKINLNIFSSGTESIDYSTSKNVNYSFGFNASTRVATSDFLTLDGSIADFNFTVYKFDAYVNTSICSNILSASIGSLSCTVAASYGNLTILSVLYMNGEQVGQGFFTIKQSARDTYGNTRIILLALLFITLPLLGLASGALTIIFGMLGLIIAGLVNLYESGTGSSLFGTSATILWFIIAGGIILWKISRRNG